jgi:hypothetical protein
MAQFSAKGLEDVRYGTRFAKCKTHQQATPSV